MITAAFPRPIFRLVCSPDELRFTVEAPPAAGRGIRRGQHGQTYVGGKNVRPFQRQVWQEAQAAGARRGMFPEGALLLGARFFIAHQRKEGEPCGRRPDLDNLLKNLKDGLKPLWGDDCQVVGYLGYPETGKFYSRWPRVEVVVRRLT